MEVILLERIEKIGKLGDIVKVKDGYARNYLLPQNKALRASKENLSIYEKEKAKYEKLNAQKLKEAEDISNNMENISIDIIKQEQKWFEKHPLLRVRIEKLEKKSHTPKGLHNMDGYSELLERLTELEQETLTLAGHIEKLEKK